MPEMSCAADPARIARMARRDELSLVLTLAANAPCVVRNTDAATAILAETDVEFLHVSGDLHRTR